MNKQLMTELILDAKIKNKKTWEDLSQVTGLNPVCVATACLGNATLSDVEAAAVTKLLNLDSEIKKELQVYPTKGDGQMVPSDPLIYRLYEINYVYGATIKELIHEKFGDGIMSAIDFTMDIDKVEDPKGDRVKITLNGKFLPYKKW